MTAFLSKNPPRADDRDNPLRRVLATPVNDTLKELAARYDFEYFTGFGMTEAPIPLVEEPNSGAINRCGKPRTGVQCRIVDAHDLEVPAGQVGELVLRCDLPWVLTAGYHQMPEATIAAWRNGWFHTGDAFRVDTEGFYHFVDRLKDAIRRRGENISSSEVEAAVIAHPDIKDAAAVPVPADEEEDEVLIVVEPRPGRSIDPAALIEFLRPRLAHFMVPRYVRVLAELPKTPTSKVRKPLLRQEGVTADTWDREAAGLRLRRERLG
jgi:crotonobetaine/carnitine-CoA ligase